MIPVVLKCRKVEGGGIDVFKINDYPTRFANNAICKKLVKLGRGVKISSSGFFNSRYILKFDHYAENTIIAEVRIYKRRFLRCPVLVKKSLFSIKAVCYFMHKDLQEMPIGTFHHMDGKSLDRTFKSTIKGRRFYAKVL